MVIVSEFVVSVSGVSVSGVSALDISVLGISALGISVLNPSVSEGVGVEMFALSESDTVGFSLEWIDNGGPNGADREGRLEQPYFTCLQHLFTALNGISPFKIESGRIGAVVLVV